MAALTEDEIVIGLVAWLDQDVLHRDDRVASTAPAIDERRAPFVCCYADDALSGWAAITSKEKPERLELLREWRSGGSADWVKRRQFLNDGNNIYEGPAIAFVDASRHERTATGSRAHLSDEGIAAVVAEVQRQVRRRVPGSTHVGRHWAPPGTERPHKL